MENEDYTPNYIQPATTPSASLDRQRATNWPALIAAIGFSIGTVFAGGSIAYHFLVNVPEKDRAEAAIRSQEIQDRNRKSEELKRTTEKAENDYQICLLDAQADYTNRWDTHCATLSQEREKAYNRCVETNYGDARYCGYVQRVPRTGCQLPSGVAASYDAANEQSKQRCLEARNAVLSSASSHS